MSQNNLPQTEEERIENEIKAASESNVLQNMFDQIDTLNKEGRLTIGDNDTSEPETFAEPDKEVEPEPEPDTDTTAEPEPDATENEPDKVKKAESYKERIHKLKKRNYSTLSELAKEREVNTQLRQLLQDYSDTTNHAYTKNINNDLDRARLAKIQAVETGDTEALIAADEAHYAAIAELQNIKRWETQQKIEQTQPAAQGAPATFETAPDGQELLDDWLLENEHMKSDKVLSDKIATYAAALDARIYAGKVVLTEGKRAGQRMQYLSPEYFAELDDYIDHVSSSSPKTTQRSQPEAGIPIGAVRATQSASAMGNTAPKSVQITLNPYEKELVESGLTTEAAIIKQKILLKKEGKI